MRHSVFYCVLFCAETLGWSDPLEAASHQGSAGTQSFRNKFWAGRDQLRHGYRRRKY